IDPATEITSTVAVYEIAGGSSVIVNGSGTTLEEGTYVMGKDEVRVEVSKSKSILFEMPAAAFEMDFTQKNDSEATEVRDVTVNHNIKGTWELAGSDKKGELKNGVNTLPEGAKITITDVGDGTVVLKDKKEGTYTKPAEGEAETTVYTKEKGQNEITVGSENIVLYSAVLVSNKTGVAVSGDVALGTEAKTAEPSQKYVAIGAVLTLPNPPADAAYNYIADNSGEDFAWSDKVLERGESGYKVTVTAGKDIVLYKAFKVVVGDGVAAKVGTEAISGTVYVASGEEVKASVADTTLRGVKVVKVTDKMVGLESEMTYTDAAISAELELVWPIR
ncbi:MAG: hypothetical protein K2P22_08440, partial [Lachnospiraceae bacterium]|nr:hypothetical protein [Lachnospiraceae bacterium]